MVGHLKGCTTAGRDGRQGNGEESMPLEAKALTHWEAPRALYLNNNFNILKFTLSHES